VSKLMIPDWPAALRERMYTKNKWTGKIKRHISQLPTSPAEWMETRDTFDSNRERQVGHSLYLAPSSIFSDFIGVIATRKILKQ